MFYTELKEQRIFRRRISDENSRLNKYCVPFKRACSPSVSGYFCFSSDGTSFTPGRMVNVELNFL